VFGDPLAITFLDPDHSEGEFRFITFVVLAEPIARGIARRP
jgi:hypothetical protein